MVGRFILLVGSCSYSVSSGGIGSWLIADTISLPCPLHRTHPGFGLSGPHAIQWIILPDTPLLSTWRLAHSTLIISQTSGLSTPAKYLDSMLHAVARALFSSSDSNCPGICSTVVSFIAALVIVFWVIRVMNSIALLTLAGTMTSGAFGLCCIPLLYIWYIIGIHGGIPVNGPFWSNIYHSLFAVCVHL